MEVFIHSNYEFLIVAITSLEKQELLLADTIKIIENIQSKFEEVSRIKGVDIYIINIKMS